MIARMVESNKAAMARAVWRQKIDMAARKRMSRRKPATIGVMSIMPMRGMN
jgi:hypothetical protein